MYESDMLIGTKFLAYYPDNDPGERLIGIDLGYNLVFAKRLYDKDNAAWRQLLLKINGTLKQYEAEQN